MSKSAMGLLGLTLLLFSFYFYKNIEKSEKLASVLDDDKKGYGVIEGPPPCNWEVVAPQKVMSENKTQAILINTKNESDVSCETWLYLRTPNFDISPNKEEQKISLEKGGSGSISWIITPRKTGVYEISITDNISTNIFGISVTNMFGLSSVQAKVVSTLGTIFGPMLTIPWWWDRLRKKKE